MTLMYNQVLDALNRLRTSYVKETPFIESQSLGRLLGCKLLLKLENLQLSGCFKVRGVTNKLLSTDKNDLAKGIITVSGGNHGIATAIVANQLGIKATVIIPKTAPVSSRSFVKESGSNLVEVDSSEEAFETVKEFPECTFIHPYDDEEIISGHGSIGLEMINKASNLTDVIVSIGGGGLISGLCAAIKEKNPHIRIWGVETKGAEAMSAALAQGKPVTVDITSICSTLGAPIVTTRTLDCVKKYVEDIIVVSDEDALNGIQIFAHREKIWTEPAAGCLFSATNDILQRIDGSPTIALVICGGNFSIQDYHKYSHLLKHQ